MKMCSASLMSVDLQIKATVKCSTPTEMTNEKRRQSGCEKVEKSWNPCSLWGSVKWCGHCGKQFGGPPKNYTEDDHVHQQLHVQVHNQKKRKEVFKQRLVSGCIYNSTSHNSSKVQTAQTSTNR